MLTRATAPAGSHRSAHVVGADYHIMPPGPEPPIMPEPPWPLPPLPHIQPPGPQWPLPQPPLPDWFQFCICAAIQWPWLR